MTECRDRKTDSHVLDAGAEMELAQRLADWGCDRGISGPWRLDDETWVADMPSGKRQTWHGSRASAAHAMTIGRHARALRPHEIPPMTTQGGVADSD